MRHLSASGMGGMAEAEAGSMAGGNNANPRSGLYGHLGI
jgi:hypothetical protein